MSQRILMLAAIFGFTAVALGAFGAHGLPRRLEGLPPAEQAKRLENWKTASDYLMFHALALGLVGATRGERRSRAGAASAVLFVAGCGLFSGCLYAWCLTGFKPLVHVVPLGGLAFLGGWAMWLVAIARGGAGKR